MRKIILISAYLLATLTLSAQSWREIYTDTILQNLIEEALEANSDIRIAKLSIEQSEAILKNAKLSYLPGFSLAPSATATKAQGQQSTLSYELPVRMNWEINFGGKRRHQKKMAEAQVLQSQMQFQYMQISLVAELANVYYTLVMLDRQLEISRQALQNQQENVDAFRALREVGQQTETAVNQAEASCLNVAASIPTLESQIRQTETAICLLLNRQADAVERSSWDAVGGVALDSLDNIPLENLASRPDVLVAEYGLRVAFSNVDVARSEFYPTLSISGSAGWTNNVGEIVNPSVILFNAIGSLVQPLFAQGTLKANLRVAKAQREQAQINFEKTLLTAGGEVRDALGSRDACNKREESRNQQVEACQRAYDNSKEFMCYSNVTYLEVLVAQSTLLDAQLVQTAEWLEKQQSMINLYKVTCIGY